MDKILEKIIDAIPGKIEVIKSFKDSLLADAVMVSEIPSPTFHEKGRIEFLLNRFNESKLEQVDIDDEGNVMGLLPGTEGKNTILVWAHTDTVFSSEKDHAVVLTEKELQGPGIGDNSLGVSVTAGLPWILEKLGIKLKDNLLIVGSVKSLGRGDLAGIRSFLAQWDTPIRSGVCVQGITLGRLSYSAFALVRARIALSIPPEYDWSQFGAAGAIGQLTRLINSMMAIPVPRSPETQLIFGALNCGNSYKSVPRHGELRFEVRSVDLEQVNIIMSKIRDIIDASVAESGTKIELDILASRSPGGIEFSHPLVKTVRKVMDELDVLPRVAPTTGELTALLNEGIPGVTLGLSTGVNPHELDESIEIEPIFKGITQLTTLLECIDEGLCDG